MKNEQIKLSEWLTIFVALGLTLILTLANLGKSQRTQRDLNRIADLDAIATALGVYYLQHDRYPPAVEDGRILACGWQGETICEWGQVWEDDQYIYSEKLPIDGLAIKGEDWPDYYYQPNTDNRHYQLVATLETEGQKEAVSSQQQCPGNWQPTQYVVCR